MTPVWWPQLTSPSWSAWRTVTVAEDNVGRVSARLLETETVISERQKHRNTTIVNSDLEETVKSVLNTEGNLNFLHLSVTYKVPDKAHSSVRRS